ncbi:MAG: hypothetical protein GC201_10935 [Alphaproteobacteria bacterium]|nr:hypothetical protein [Alphaproteobacteria bacterium]
MNPKIVLMAIGAAMTVTPAVAAGSAQDHKTELAQWCTNDKTAAGRDLIYDPNCPGTHVKRNPDGTWGDSPSSMGTGAGQDTAPGGSGAGSEGSGGSAGRTPPGSIGGQY